MVISRYVTSLTYCEDPEVIISGSGVSIDLLRVTYTGRIDITVQRQSVYCSEILWFKSLLPIYQNIRQGWKWNTELSSQKFTFSHPGKNIGQRLNRRLINDKNCCVVTKFHLFFSAHVISTPHYITMLWMPCNMLQR